MARRTTPVSVRLFAAAADPATNRSATGRTGTWGSSTRWGMTPASRRAIRSSGSSELGEGRMGPRLTQPSRPIMILVMRRSPSQRLLSGLLLLILGALGTGLPSHSHRVAGDDSDQLVAPEHHDHGVVLTEQTDRMPTVAVPHAMPAGATRIADRPVLVAYTDPTPQGDLPHERAPPSTSPRAPPLPI